MRRRKRVSQEEPELNITAFLNLNFCDVWIDSHRAKKNRLPSSSSAITVGINIDSKRLASSKTAALTWWRHCYQNLQRQRWDDINFSKPTLKSCCQSVPVVKIPIYQIITFVSPRFFCWEETRNPAHDQTVYLVIENCQQVKVTTMQRKTTFFVTAETLTRIKLWHQKTTLLSSRNCCLFGANFLHLPESGPLKSRPFHS